MSVEAGRILAREEGQLAKEVNELFRVSERKRFRAFMLFVLAREEVV